MIWRESSSIARFLAQIAIPRYATMGAKTTEDKPDEYYWIDSIDDLTTEQTAQNKSLIFGNESCGEYLIDQARTSLVASLLDSGALSGIILPYLTPEREAGFLRLLNEIKKPTMIIINDVGAYMIVKKSCHRIVLGRLLSGQNTDPAIFQFMSEQPDRCISIENEVAILKHVPPPIPLIRHFREVPLLKENSICFFLDDDLKATVMLDNVPQGLPEKVPSGCSVMLNLENILVSVIPCGDCADCPKREVKLGVNRSQIGIYRKRNSVYYKRSECDNGGGPGLLKSAMAQDDNL
jgi:hypothetical protein